MLFLNQLVCSCAWWHIPVVPALERQRQECQEFKESLEYILRARPTWGYKRPPPQKQIEDWRDGSTGATTDCTSRGSGFDFQPPMAVQDLL